MTDSSATVRVALGDRSYDIEIGSGILAQAGPFIASRVKLSHAVVITDENVERPHAQTVAASLEKVAQRVDVVLVPAGEQSKSVAVADQLWQRLIELRADRKSVIVAVGGGVIGDLAGFIAATFGRGLSFFQIPTTLLAHVDSSVGGKVGVNLPTAKNMVGAFWQPRGVLIDTQVIDTLPDRDFRAGLAEVIKYGVILDEEFFRYLESHQSGIQQRDASVMRHIIARSCRLKADVVENDEREETGLRAVLNYGHTFCHAIETVTGYGEYLHGEAVAIGMVCAADLAHAMGRIDDEFVRRQKALIQSLNLPVALPAIPTEPLINAMQRDKKVEHGSLRFVLPTKLGHVELVSDVPVELVRAALVRNGAVAAQ